MIIIDILGFVAVISALIWLTATGPKRGRIGLLDNMYKRGDISEEIYKKYLED